MIQKRIRLQRDLTLLSTSMFIVVTAWIGLNVYDSYATSTISETLQTQIIPIDGHFDLQALQRLKNRPVIEPVYSVLSNTNSENTTLQSIPQLNTPETTQPASVTFSPTPIIPTITSQITNTPSPTQPENQIPTVAQP